MFGLHSKFKYKQVVIVREDLKLSKGKLSVQVAHAAVSCAIKAEKNKNNFFLEWFTEGQKKVVLKVENLDFLLKIFNEAKTIGLITELIKDAGLTEVPPGTITVLGIGPAPEEEIDKIVGDLKLL
ncbi:MAG: Peptidyl-tRNA hydrolase [Candidatus Methanofastidiosum methylothiophilum]|mgnify:FL=1|jgi:PTH2 family peptidyl-tRNA hydrolase|uniref:Peptidyl-tRNA hydrolase n=1 Tax=Candidatus Methanofastidiosum methylothiophilum TaxID=1705564 RepID=A0A150JK98_9EURY|nr:MAG: Peptidyl-tRNA hydrolase [Candidatus Methanofastidiosum methylthiophilus]MBP6931972.1 peptidyl-tRNA hydrolase Pth2 [Methanofastidiosum sp.]OQC52789.1 MAG: Peptidyl-tRNA hydrolase [Euryarchaeota archaeon ADurb.Bin023]KYC57650.1 MAG: Peptidyl-tRNA hydrolase [Candidatus Methanofastidiosum methylthiophilus]KYC58460.1 MAG: Peptidyl-tRNA hydrolase [Candidatus Methanofastidiosum methylthiophilus]